MTRVVLAPATTDDVDAMVAAWVALAEDQRTHGARLLGAENRAAVREDLARRAVLGEAVVARLADGDGEAGPGDDPDARADRTEVAVEVDTDAGDDGPARRVVDCDVSPAAFGGDLPATFVGFVSFGLEVDGFERDRERGVVHNVYVRPGARSAGVGSALLAAAEAELRAAGAEAVVLEALAANDRARAFYRRAGYREHRVELEKSLDPG